MQEPTPVCVLLLLQAQLVKTVSGWIDICAFLAPECGNVSHLPRLWV